MLDPLLRPVVDAVDETEAAHELNILIEEHLLPLARAIVGRKLRSYGEDRPGRSNLIDQEDVVADAMAMLVERLHPARTGTDEAPVENVVSYAAAVIHSACARYIRHRYPERARLKDRLRYVFSTERRLALWSSEEGDLVCGLVEWRGRSVDAGARRTLRGYVERNDLTWAALSRAQMIAAITDVAIAVGGPVDFETFVGTVASATRIVEPRDGGDLSTLSHEAAAPDVLIDQRRFLARVWDEVGNLPVRQRNALLLSLHDPAGAGLLWLLPIAGVATVRQIARLLDIPDAEFALLWREIPLDDSTIAQRLGCPRQQVVNLRVAARKRLMNHVGETARSTGGTSRPRGNLDRISASLKGRA